MCVVRSCGGAGHTVGAPGYLCEWGRITVQRLLSQVGVAQCSVITSRSWGCESVQRVSSLGLYPHQ